MSITATTIDDLRAAIKEASDEERSLYRVRSEALKPNGIPRANARANRLAKSKPAEQIVVGDLVWHGRSVNWEYEGVWVKVTKITPLTLIGEAYEITEDRMYRVSDRHSPKTARIKRLTNGGTHRVLDEGARAELMLTLEQWKPINDALAEAKRNLGRLRWELDCVRREQDNADRREKEARRRAVEVLIERHEAEFEALLADFRLAVLAEQAEEGK